MPRKLRPRINFHQQAFRQISESHCGPAVIQMLLSHLGIQFTQEEIAEAAGVGDRIVLHGTRIDQLAAAVQKLAPGVRFFYKEHATIDELVRIVNDYKYPVGVEWQGVFDDDDEVEDERDEGRSQPAVDPSLLHDSESEDDDYGHYSIVIRADRRRKLLIIADPYKDYFEQDRIFTFHEFDERWWDTNEYSDPITGAAWLVEDDHMMFVLVPRGVRFPLLLGMHLFDGEIIRD